MPSRLMTARPPSRPISIAREGLTTPSMAAAMMGISNRRPQSSHEMSTSLGLMVSAPGTSAISSKPYAALALRPRPTHMPMRHILLGPPPHQAPYVENRLAVATVFRGRVYGCPRRVSTAGDPGTALGIRPLPDHPQPLEPQIGVDLLKALAHLAHLLREAARRHHPHVALELAAHACHEPVDEAGVPVDDARLDIGGGVAADGVLGAHDLDPRQPGSTRHQCLGGEHEPGRDGASDELASRVDDIEIGGGAKVHDDEGGAVDRHARDDVAHAVRANFVRVI